MAWVFDEARGAWVKKGDQEVTFRDRPIADVQVKVMDMEQKVLRVVISTEHRDRHGDIVRASGAILSNYQLGPVFWGHESWDFPIAKSIRVRKVLSGAEMERVGERHIWADAHFAGLEYGHAKSQLAFDLAVGQFVNKSSIGASFHERKDLPDDTPDGPSPASPGIRSYYPGYEITRWELLEWSLVGIPANPQASVQRDFANAEWPVERVMDRARKYLEGSELDAFRKDLLDGDTDIVCLSGKCFPIKEAPERTRAVMPESFASDVDPSEDLGFDLTEQVLGYALPEYPDEKAAEPESSAVTGTGATMPSGVVKFADGREDPAADNAPPTSKSACSCQKQAPPTDPAVDALRAELDALRKDLDGLRSAPAPEREPSAPVDLEAIKQHIDAGFEAFGARLTKLESEVVTSYVDIFGKHEDEKHQIKCSHGRKAATSQETAADPASAEKDAPPPARRSAVDSDLGNRLVSAARRLAFEEEQGIVR